MLIRAQSIEKYGQSDKTYYDNGNLFTEKVFNQSTNNTKDIIYWEDGVTKKGEFEINSDGETLYSRYFYNNGILAGEDYYNKGKFISSKCWDPYGIVIECKLENGHFKIYYESGNLQMEGFKIDGEWHGIIKMYYENGNLLGEMTYIKGVKYGTSKFYYENGTMKLETNDNGEKVLRYPNGNIEHEGQLKSGLATGLWKYYYENGKIQYEGNWKDDKEDGLWREFDESGNFVGEFRYNNGKIVEK